HGHVPARFRLAAHAVAGGLAVGMLGGFRELPLGLTTVQLGWFGAAFALLWTIWLLNLFNFMDGIDALAGTETVFVAGAAITLMALRQEGVGPTGLALGVLASATAGFLWWNWPPARIFLGDVGSGFLGFALAVIALADMSGPGGGLGLPVWVLLNGVFLVDATYTLLRRIATGQQWYSPHRSHAYQKATVMLGGHRPVVAYVGLFNVLWLFPWALAATLRPGMAIPMLIVALFPLFAVTVWLKAGDP
ncbi:MAG: glycosyl transferase, partial [Gammaproteobacteria bacterium]|nr:glycosyl transferase [Gammaproteobacteria bacterium]